MCWLTALIGGVIALFQSIQMLCPSVIVLLLLAGTVRPWMVIILSLVIGITDALSMPSFQSIVPSIVKPAQIASGLALNLSRILGPALAAILLISIGAVGCFAVSAASYIPLIVVALWILPQKLNTPPVDATSEQHSLFVHIFEILRIPQLRGALLTVFFTSLLCGPLVIFCSVLIKNTFHRDAVDFSIAVAAFGIGGLLGAIVLLFINVDSDRRYLSSWAARAYGVVLVLVACNPWFWSLPVLFVLGGSAMSISNISANTLIQTNTTSQLRGQSVSLFMLALRGGISIGGLLTGFSVTLIGVNRALLLNGVLTLLAQIVVGRKWFKAK